jgi:hypothetical protein
MNGIIQEMLALLKADFAELPKITVDRVRLQQSSSRADAGVPDKSEVIVDCCQFDTGNCTRPPQKFPDERSLLGSGWVRISFWINRCLLGSKLTGNRK